MALLFFFVCFTVNYILGAGQSVLYVLKGRQAILFPTLSDAPDDILWKHNGDKVITFDSKEEHIYPPYEDRVTLSWSTAELTITDLGYEDSGEYELDALMKGRLHRSQYILKVLDKVSKPVIQCKMLEDSGNSTSEHRATLLCSSDSNTPEVLTFKWNLEGKSQLGQALTIALGSEHDHIRYSCTASNPIHAETSTFTAKDCYTDEGPGPWDVIVPIVIALLILSAFIFLTLLFRHQIKRACLKEGKNDDLEKQMADADHKNGDEGTPFMRDNIHRQETFASKQPLIQQNEPVKEIPQKKQINEELQEIRALRKVGSKKQVFNNDGRSETQAATQTAEAENHSEVGEVGHVDSEKETDFPKPEGGGDTDSNHSEHSFYDAQETEDFLQTAGEHENPGKTDHPNHEGDPGSFPSGQVEKQKDIAENETGKKTEEDKTSDTEEKRDAAGSELRAAETEGPEPPSDQGPKVKEDEVSLGDSDRHITDKENENVDSDVSDVQPQPLDSKPPAADSAPSPSEQNQNPDPQPSHVEVKGQVSESRSEEDTPNQNSTTGSAPSQSELNEKPEDSESRSDDETQNQNSTPCLKEGKNDDLDKQMADADDNQKTDPVKEITQQTQTAKEMQELNKSGRVKGASQMFNQAVTAENKTALDKTSDTEEKRDAAGSELPAAETEGPESPSDQGPKLKSGATENKEEKTPETKPNPEDEVSLGASDRHITDSEDENVEPQPLDSKPPADSAPSQSDQNQNPDPQPSDVEVKDHEESESEPGENTESQDLTSEKKTKEPKRTTAPDSEQSGSEESV